MPKTDSFKERVMNVFPLIILASFIAGYWTSISKLIHRWNSGDDNYCFLIIPLFLYLCWEKRRHFRFAEFSWSIWGLIPTTLAILMMILGERGSAETLIYIGFWGFLSGMATILYGGRIRHLAFPFLILFFIVPLPPFLNRLLTFKLKMVASMFSADMLRMVGVTVVQEGNILDLGIGQLEVADACSGLRYFMPMILMGLLIGYFFTKGLWKKVLLLVLVVPLSILINAVRVFSAGIFTVTGHPELAQNLFHDFSGWLAFMAAGLVLTAIAYLLMKIGPSPIVSEIQDAGSKPVGLQRPAVLSLIICILLLAGGMGINHASTTAHTPPHRNFLDFPIRIGEWEGTRMYLSDDILAALWADDYIYATYRSAASSDTISILIPFYAYQGTLHTAHAPQSCLLGGGWTLLSSSDVSIKVTPNKHIPVRVMILTKDNQHLLSSYFFLQRGRVIISPWMNKLYLLRDSLIRNRTDGALVRVELHLADSQSPEQAQAELSAFILRLWQILPDYVPE
jgi:exosortase D (VPLPA-CTERM-specific)